MANSLASPTLPDYTDSCNAACESVKNTSFHLTKTSDGDYGDMRILWVLKHSSKVALNCSIQTLVHTFA